MSNVKKKIIVAGIISIAAVLAIVSSWGDSLIVDEIPHIGAGYSYLVKNDMRLNPEHPPLAKDLAAVPLTFLNLKQDAFQSKFWQTDVNGQWDFGRILIFNSGNNADLIKNLARLPMLLFFMLSAMLIFKWARKLYGETAAFTALILFSFSPTIIVHSRFVTTDMAALFGVFFATYFFIKYLKNQTWKNLFIASVFFGIALLLKFSTILLAPFFLLLAVIYGLTANRKKFLCAGRNVFCSILIFITGIIFIVWPVYYFNTHNYPAERQRRDAQSTLTMIYGESYARYAPILDFVVKSSADPLLKPLAWYSTGLLRVLHQTSEPHEVYFLGQINLYGARSYFPIVYFLKEPLAWWVLALIALLFLGWQLKRPSRESVSRSVNFIKNHFEEFGMLLWLAIYWTTSIRSTFNIGVRHLLPTYPFAILLVSGQLARVINAARARGRKIFIALFSIILFLFGWYIYESVHIYPYYLAYFNQVAGGPSGASRYVVDSNLDWGQDLKRFSSWVKENNIPKIETDYFGWADPYYYLKERYIWISSIKYKDALDFKRRNQSNGWLAVSATFLKTSAGPDERPRRPNYFWLNSYTPVTVVGNSISVYHIK